jgi:hypothetical protein
VHGAPPKGARPASGAASDDESFLQSLLAIEARRLHDLTSAPDHQRRDALLDLASRLVPLDAELPDEAGGLDLDGWQALLDLLRPDRLAIRPIDQVWADVLRVLDALVAASQPTGVRSAAAGAESPVTSRPPGRVRPAFWKHFPDR